MATMIIPAISAIVTYTPDFKVGDPQPEGYIDRQEWARVQMKGGLRQTQCPDCSCWKFPQQLSTQEVRWSAKGRRGREHHFSAFRCADCAEKQP